MYKGNLPEGSCKQHRQSRFKNTDPLGRKAPSRGASLWAVRMCKGVKALRPLKIE